MLSLIEILAPADPKKKSEPSDADTTTLLDQSGNQLAGSHENSDQFLSAFADISQNQSQPTAPTDVVSGDPTGSQEYDLEPLPSEIIEEGLREVEPQAGDNVLPPLPASHNSLIPANDHDTPSLASTSPLAQNSPHQIIPAKNPGDHLLRVAATSAQTQSVDLSSGIDGKVEETPAEDIKDADLNKSGAKNRPPDSNLAAQFNWDNRSPKAKETIMPQGHATINSAIQNATVSGPVQANATPDILIAPTVPNSSIPMTPTIAQTGPVHFMSNPAPTQQVAEALASVTRAQDKLVVRLDPPELGRVTIEFQFDNNRGITAVVTAENADIGSQLRDRSEFLFKTLRSAGFGEIDLNFDTRSNTADDGGDLQQGNGQEMIDIHLNENDLIQMHMGDAIPQQHLILSDGKLNILL